MSNTSTTSLSNAHFDLNQSINGSGKRQRSQSFGHPLAIESASSASSSSVEPTTYQQNFELVPYREWTVIARNNEKGQLVLYNQDNQAVTVQHYLTEPHFTSLDPNTPIQVTQESGNCPYCHQAIPETTTKPKNDEPDYMDRNYFRLLASSQSSTAANSPAQSRSSTFSSATPANPAVNAQNLNENAFNQGYYSKFFVEVNKLGKGFRGSVFLCEHMLDGVKLGKYAIKKVAIGNNHPWLVRMLREVHLLERLRHPNIVSYKHSWLEYNRLTAFGPEVPCLFILMECANGGNLEEYFEPPPKPKEEEEKRQPSSSAVPNRRMSSKELKRERIKKQYQEQENFEKEQDISSPSLVTEKRLLTMREIWSLFLDIVQGLAHLHQQNIVHRDLKPPNLLLQYDDRNRNSHHGIPRVLISDFGECEDLDETHRNDENRTGATGTLEFMAPEHVRLDPRGRNTVDYSPKADMWSLGMVLYYLCYSKLPYSVIDDVDILRREILEFRDVRFPASRFDIYKSNPKLYNEAINNPNLQSDIPSELKLLIRMLLSIDPAKRPSCNKILSKLRSIQREDENNAAFRDMPNDWNSKSRSSTSSGSQSSTPSSTATTTSTTATSRQIPTVSEEPINIIPTPTKSSTKRPNNSNNTTGSIESMSNLGADSNSSASLRKRQRLLHNNSNFNDQHEIDGDGDTIIQEAITEDNSPRLLLGSPDIIPEPSAGWLTERQSINIIKTVTAILKIASCTYSCSPYSTKPTTLYPIIFFATLDFWSESTSPSFLLLTLHIVWIMGTTLFSGGLCEAESRFDLS